MTELRVLAVAGSLNDRSATRLVIGKVAADLRARGCEVELLDLANCGLGLFDPDTAYQTAAWLELKPKVEQADVILLGTPDYHGTMSGVLKNFLDHFWKEFTGKLFATVVASYDKGLTVTDHLRTVARQCYAWSMPYAMVFADKEDVAGGEIKSEALQRRLEMFARDIHVYGGLLAGQRARDLAGTEAGFLARLRK